MHFAAVAFLPHRGGWRYEFCKEFAAISPSWRKCLASSALRRRPFCVPKRAPLHGNAARFNPQGGPFRNGGRPEPPLLPRFVNILLRQGRFAVRQRQWHCHCLQAMRQYPGLQSAQCFPRCAGNHEKTHFIEKKAPKVLQFQKNALPLHSQSADKAGATLGYGVMVTLQILVLSFLVRVRVSQQRDFLWESLFVVGANAAAASQPRCLPRGCTESANA